MQLRKIAIAMLALMLAGAVLVPYVSAADSYHEMDQATAQKIADIHIKEIAKISPTYAEWESGSVHKSTIYYDLLDRKSAYQFNVDVGGAYAGYVLIAASRDNYPVLEFSRGTVPGEQPE
ncbi:MAG: hypothetical protein M0Q92_16205, partial [Methanoregula sp.]|nr:hypothetical protein [Methanoregula sp.]